MNCPTSASIWTVRGVSRNRRGFTLVETLVAGVVLAISAAVLGTTVSQAMRSLTLARDYQRAAELLDKTLAKVDLIGPARLMYEMPENNVFDPPHDRFSWQMKIDSRNEGDLYEVTVYILWRTPAGESRWIQGQTLLNDPPDSRPGELYWDEL